MLALTHTAQGPRELRWTWKHSRQGRWSPKQHSCRQNRTVLGIRVSRPLKAAPHSPLPALWPRRLIQIVRIVPTPSLLICPSNPQLSGDWGNREPSEGLEGGRQRGKEENELGQLPASSLWGIQDRPRGGSAGGSRRPFLYNSLFWILITAPSLCPFGLRGATALLSYLAFLSILAHILADSAL